MKDLKLSVENAMTPSTDLLRDFSMFKQPPVRLDGTPPSKNRVYKVQEGSFHLNKIWEGVGAGSG
jgi:hypothetical protein